MKRTVRDLMRQKDLTKIPVIQQESNIESGILALERYDSGALLVMDDKKLVGIFSERDLARFIAANRRSLNLQAKLSSIMSREIICVTPEYRLEECMALMSKRHIRHLPVLEEGIPIALLSMRHIMQALIEDKEFMIEELVKYVTGSNFPEKGPMGPAVL